MRLLATLMIAVFTASFTVAAEVKLTGDNTKIEWTGTKKDGKHTGGFKTLTGSATTGEKMAIHVEIDVDSMYSDNEQLTGHLKGADFFNVKEHPKAKFTSKKIEKGTVTGEFTMLGKSKEISFPATIKTDGGFKLDAEFKINRTDYGMTYGKGKVDDDVALKVKVDAK